MESMDWNKVIESLKVDDDLAQRTLDDATTAELAQMMERDTEIETAILNGVFGKDGGDPDVASTVIAELNKAGYSIRPTLEKRASEPQIWGYSKHMTNADAREIFGEKPLRTVMISRSNVVAVTEEGAVFVLKGTWQDINFDAGRPSSAATAEDRPATQAPYQGACLSGS